MDWPLSEEIHMLLIASDDEEIIVELDYISEAYKFTSEDDEIET